MTSPCLDPSSDLWSDGRVLVVEDDRKIARLVTKGLGAAGLRTVSVEGGRAAVEMASDSRFDLVVLDLGLPDIDGHEVLRQIRANGQLLPVLIVTGRPGAADVVAGLDGGADDYLAKPFRMDELVSRVRARIRESRRAHARVVCGGAVMVDLRRHRVHVDGRPVSLTAREFRLLQMFVEHGDEVLSRQMLLSTVWGYDFDPGSNVVDVYVRYLRLKLGPDTIQTVRGMGYRLRG